MEIYIFYIYQCLNLPLIFTSIFNSLMRYFTSNVLQNLYYLNSRADVNYKIFIQLWSEVFFEIISEFRKVSPVPPTPPSTPNLSPSFLHNSSLNRSQQVGNIINKPYHQSDRSTQQPFSNQPMCAFPSTANSSNVQTIVSSPGSARPSNNNYFSGMNEAPSAMAGMQAASTTSRPQAGRTRIEYHSVFHIETGQVHMLPIQVNALIIC